MDPRGDIIPAADEPLSQWNEYVKRQIDESVPVKTDNDGMKVRIGMIDI